MDKGERSNQVVVDLTKKMDIRLPLTAAEIVRRSIEEAVIEERQRIRTIALDYGRVLDEQGRINEASGVKKLVLLLDETR